MSRTYSDLLSDLAEIRERRTTRQQHGGGVLSLVDGMPKLAEGCLLPDGSTTDARCVAGQLDDAVWFRKIQGTRLGRRGRLVIEDGTALRFVDEPEADVAQGEKHNATDLALDLAESERIREQVKGDLFAGFLYAALCNNDWRHDRSNDTWSCTWRRAGDVVADLRSEGNYLDWYCWGHEGMIDEVVLAELGVLGWHPATLESE